MSNSNSSKNVLVCMQHPLTPAQNQELQEMGVTVSYLKNVDPSLFASLSAMKGDEDLYKLASDLIHTQKGGYLLLPIGSPAFNFVLSSEMARHASCRDGVPSVLFSHTDRVCTSVEKPDGSVETVRTIQHVRFIALRPSVG